MSLHESLRLLRMSSHLKGKDLATSLGLSAAYLSQIESGKRVPTLDCLETYAGYFGVPVSSLFWMAETLEAARQGAVTPPAMPPKLTALLQMAAHVTSRARSRHG